MFSIKLQHRQSDIVRAYSDVKPVIDELNTVRGNDELLHAWYVQAEDLAGEIGVTPSVPRTAGRQCHRDTVQLRNITAGVLYFYYWIFSFRK